MIQERATSQLLPILFICNIGRLQSRRLDADELRIDKEVTVSDVCLL
jgi:hypothetical protein